MSSNPLGLKRIHHVELWSGNAKQSAFFYRHALGFSQFAYRGLESGDREQCCHALNQGNVNLVITSPLTLDGPIGEHVRRHGDGVRDIVFEVENADAAFRHAVSRGARPFQEPHDRKDDHGSVRWSSIHAYGDTIHSFLHFKDYDGPFLPGYIERSIPGESTGIRVIDHMVANVELGKMEYWAGWFADVMGFERFITFDDKDISTEYSALMSIVMSDGGHKIKFPINEPAEGKKKSQIEEYLDFYYGPGVQHIAFLTTDIVKTVGTLAARGIEFLHVPDAYYDDAPKRVGSIDEDYATLKKLGILVDRDEDGYLLQLFTKPVQDRPTMFFEIIQRKGAKGFGKGNFKALFESIEREQALRGTL